jgi:hypothetical protein
VGLFYHVLDIKRTTQIRVQRTNAFVNVLAEAMEPLHAAL